MNIKKPKVLKCIDRKIIDCYEDNTFSNCKFSDNIDGNIKIIDTTFDSCIFDHIDFF